MPVVRSAWWAGPLAASLLCGCGGIQVRPLATGQVEQPAYQLNGQNLAQLRSEAQRLCPQGAEVLREAQRLESGHDAPGPSRWSRWAHEAQLRLAPATQEAQLLVLCQRMPGMAALPPKMMAKAPVPAASAAADAVDGSAKPASSAATPRPMPVSPVGEGDVRDGQLAALPPVAVRSPTTEPTPEPKPKPARRPMRASSAPVLSY
ncbi:hypothetical protein [Aquabacterium sp. OR-4]|uniref:hypothetical protein n=1 Tax=Aquabacterium sp. OR-4 TaxID=2978127 RepID=UPI0028C8FAED|nr:hypothetical protein [Aquabacterium sp. OR-4]MDT7834656.1 hypothetical protein [Aquabacterium sp. OR-4]